METSEGIHDPTQSDSGLGREFNLLLNVQAAFETEENEFRANEAELESIAQAQMQRLQTSTGTSEDYNEI